MKTISKVALAGAACFAAAKTAHYFYRSPKGSAKEYPHTNPDITPLHRVEASAHRSGAGVMPEESLMAFAACAKSTEFKTDTFEFDLHSTKDGVLVLQHDDTLDRTTDCVEVFGEKNVRPEDKTYDELRRLNIGARFVDVNGNMPYAGYSGDSVPDNLRIQRLETVLDFLTKHGSYKYIIDIKNPGELGFRGVDTLYKILEERGLLESTIFGNFHGEISRYVDKNYPLLRRSAGIVEVIAFYYSAMLGIKRDSFKYVALQIPCKKAGFNLATSRLVNYAHRHNLAVQFWTVNSAPYAKYLKSIGADCVMSDYPDDIYKALNL